MTKNDKFDLKVYPLGGVGEIGSNLTVFETENHLIVIDAGILFPYEDFFDINYLVVDSKGLPENKEVTLFITHGHEDHIGAVHHFLEDYPQAKIHAPLFAKNLLHKKFERYDVSYHIQEYIEKDTLSFDNYELHPVHVTHSIPDTYGLIFKDINNETAVLFISDFKYDENPLFEEPFNIKKIQELFTPCKNRIAMLDSTNIMVPGRTLSESDLTEDLQKIIDKKKRTFLTMFASNTYRMKNILELATKSNRRIITIGRAIQRYLEVAQESNLINLADYNLFDLDQIQNHEDERNFYLVTGSQGEYMGATKRIANGDQKFINLNSNDVFAFSSKPIPGNEKKIYRLYNQLAERNVEIVTFRDHKIHASGHPGQEDLFQLISEAKPNHYIPIHGETFFLRAHIEFIKKSFPQIQIYFLQNFDGYKVFNNKISVFEQEAKDPHIIHGSGIRIEREKISERRKMACNGVVFISINLKTRSVFITTKGLPFETEDMLDDLDQLINFTAFGEFKGKESEKMSEQVRIRTRNFFKEHIGYKPITTIHLL